MDKVLHYDRNHPSEAVKRLLIAFALFHLLMWGITIRSFSLEGFIRIMTAECGLITDTIITGGLSASFLNSAVLVLMCVLFIQISGSPFAGNSFAAVIMTAGFAFFGINPLNMAAIMTGTYLYSLVRKESFGQYVHIGIWACCGGPVVEYMFVHGGFSAPVNVILGILLGVLTGFLVPPCASAAANAHEGMNLYNAGFATGIVLIGLSAVLKGFGYTFAAVSTWYTEEKLLLTVYLLILHILWFLCGWLLNGKSFAHLDELSRRSGQKCDLVKLDGIGAAMMNMAVTGLIGLVYILLIGGDLSGPVLSGILSMLGFGAIGKHFRNVIWVMLGIVLLSFVSGWNLTDPAVQFSALLGTCICTFAGKYGPFWGILAGMIHISIVRQSGSFHAWLNLYNNGFAGGLTSIILLPVAKTFSRNKD